MSDTRILSGSICASICSLGFALLTPLLIERRFRAQNVCHLRHMYREACCWLTLVAFLGPAHLEVKAAQSEAFLMDHPVNLPSV